MTVAGRRFYPIQVAEKGFAAYRIARPGTWGHGSMPRDDNAAVLAAAVIDRLAEPGPDAPDAGHGPLPRRLAAAELPPDATPHPRRAVAGDDPRPGRGRDRGGLRPDVRASPAGARARHRSARTSSTPGIKYNVIPGDATIEVDCRVLPGTTEPAMRAELVDAARPGARRRLRRSS